MVGDIPLRKTFVYINWYTQMIRSTGPHREECFVGTRQISLKQGYSTQYWRGNGLFHENDRKARMPFVVNIFRRD